ncbi:Oxidoreductase family, NAD-binding Rossmann fold [Micromonospora rhizosphaerae]|uniref:Oxidoreductase family, NAD-binding Rossmann fold n=1 Tax=Micromonospora rhizosphaerae TaxID=568872 RepID=A0A1C6SAV8_9ACTN|nr:Gfo/Idh/MocA family oxidoreductase [Micromonospora rhizosphaerae]SCL26603.1 Oxidoreductase family, NAD-binding Rossmann fold [Micromonospora rhizosphaerae]
MARIGLVDLDTSHPGAFTPLLRAMDHDVVAVWHHGPHGPAAEFAAQHGIRHVFDDLYPMADAVDLALVSGADWSTHIERVTPFVAAGRAVLLDKPFAGNAADLAQLVEWAGHGVRLSGGSSLRWAVERDPDAEFALAGCSGHEFDYGIHAYSLLHGLLGPGMRRARWLGGRGQARVEIAWADGRTGMVSVGETPARHPFWATVLSGRSVRHVEVDPSALYETMLHAVVPYLSGQAPDPMPMSALIEPELAALAGLCSRYDGGRWVSFDDPDLAGVEYDGPAFAAAYRRAKLR